MIEYRSPLSPPLLINMCTHKLCWPVSRPQTAAGVLEAGRFLGCFRSDFEINLAPTSPVQGLGSVIRAWSWLAWCSSCVSQSAPPVDDFAIPPCRSSLTQSDTSCTQPLFVSHPTDVLLDTQQDILFCWRCSCFKHIYWYYGPRFYLRSHRKSSGFTLSLTAGS